MSIRSTRLGSPFAGLFDRSRTQGSNTSQPTYSVSASVSSLNEGSSVTFTISTIGIFPGTTLYWTTNTVSGTINTSDFNDSVTSGSFTVTGSYESGTATVTRTLSNDLTTEGNESFQLQIRTESTSGTVVATSATITISDTSVETYSVSQSTTSLNEGSSVTFTVTTGGVPNGTTLYWSTNAVSGTVNGSDFSDGATTGSFTITSNSGSIVRTIANDLTTEGSESFQLQIRTGSTSGTVRATSATITVIDTSTTPFTATGGSESTTSRSGYKVHTFTSPGTFSVSSGTKNVEYLVVAGGGGGGEGGGGAGAIRFSNSFPMSPGPFSVTVGAGGPGSGATGSSNGNDSVFGPITATGGGRGGSIPNAPGGSGGSGGGSRRDTPGAPGPATGSSGGSPGSNSPGSGWGNPGGTADTGTWCGAGGGGGAGSGGTNGTGGSGPVEQGGNGGSGLSYSINGTATTYAGGGGGGCEGSGSACGSGGNPGPGGGGQGGRSTQTSNSRGSSNASSNTGGGGGGRASQSPAGGANNGGSGIVIIAYPTS